MRYEQSRSLAWASLFLSLFLFPTLKTLHYLPLVFSHTQFLCLSSFRSLFVPPPPLSLFPLRFPSLLVVSRGSKSEYANAMVSGGAGVSQQGQNQVSMDTQTCLACKSNWCTTWPREVSEHVPDHLMAEYPTPRLVRVERTTLVTQSGLQQKWKQRFPPRDYFNSSLSEFQSPGQLIKLHCVERIWEMSETEDKNVTCSLPHNVAVRLVEVSNVWGLSPYRG